MVVILIVVGWSVWITSRNNVIWNPIRLQLVRQYLIPILDIYVNIYKEHMPQARNGEMIAYLIVWHLGYVLAKYLDLYLASMMDLYLDNILTFGSKVRMDFINIEWCHDNRSHWITYVYNNVKIRWSLTGCFWNNWANIFWYICWWSKIFTEAWNWDQNIIWRKAR